MLQPCEFYVSGMLTTEYKDGHGSGDHSPAGRAHSRVRGFGDHPFTGLPNILTEENV
jgi:hypothetical protein